MNRVRVDCVKPYTFLRIQDLCSMCRKHTKTLISANRLRSEVLQLKPITQFGYQLFYFGNLLPMYLGHNVSIPCPWYLTAQCNLIFAVTQFFTIITDHPYESNNTVRPVRHWPLLGGVCAVLINLALWSLDACGSRSACIRVIWSGEYTSSSFKIAEIGRTDADFRTIVYNPFNNKRS